MNTAEYLYTVRSSSTMPNYVRSFKRRRESVKSSVGFIVCFEGADSNNMQ
jgi:hypothetical protein